MTSPSDHRKRYRPSPRQRPEFIHDQLICTGTATVPTPPDTSGPRQCSCARTAESSGTSPPTPASTRSAAPASTCPGPTSHISAPWNTTGDRPVNAGHRRCTVAAATSPTSGSPTGTGSPSTPSAAAAQSSSWPRALPQHEGGGHPVEDHRARRELTPANAVSYSHRANRPTVTGGRQMTEGPANPDTKAHGTPSPPAWPYAVMALVVLDRARVPGRPRRPGLRRLAAERLGIHEPCSASLRPHRWWPFRSRRSLS